MKKLLKPANIGFYILMLLVCFVFGLYFAEAINAGKNQGLAAGAIVLGYGVLIGGIGFIASFFVAYLVNIKVIIKINYLLLLLILIGCSYKYYQFKQHFTQQKEKSEKFNPAPMIPTEQTEALGMAY